MTDATRTPTTAERLAAAMYDEWPDSTPRSLNDLKREHARLVAAELAKQGVILVDREALAAALLGETAVGMFGRRSDISPEQEANELADAIIEALR